MWQGRRTALPRHQTLNAMLDWSYNLLSEHEKLVLCRLSVFVGDFTIEARLSSPPARRGRCGRDRAMASLIEKSLMAADWKSTDRHIIGCWILRVHTQ